MTAPVTVSERDLRTLLGIVGALLLGAWARRFLGRRAGLAVAAALLLLPPAVEASELGEADREALRTFLANPAVKTVAAKAGLSVEKAGAAVGTLQGDELHRAANQARTVNADLAGGATVVITTTTIIIILLVIILIVVLVN